MDKMPDYFLNGSVSINQTEISNIKCKIYLPERILDKTYMSFQLTKEQYEILSRTYKGAFKAERLNWEGKKDADIIAPTVYFTNVWRRYWGQDLEEYSFGGEPQDLLITQYDDSLNHERTSIVFLLSPNESLMPITIEKSSYDGCIKVEKSHHLEVLFYENKKLKLDRGYNTKQTEKKERLQWSYLIAKIDLTNGNLSTEQLNEMLSKIDDFLLIASLATGLRTACLGWKSINGKTITSYYRGNLTPALGMKHEFLDQGLVQKCNLQEFITQCYDSFLDYKNKDVLRSAVYSLIPGSESTLEKSFLSLFAGVETLLLDYRRQRNLEFNINPELWRKIKKKTQKEFKKMCKEYDEEEINAVQRKNLYEKVDELNRVSLRTVWHDFIRFYKIDTTDLWPLFSTSETIGLSNIRNWLIHGEPIPEECYTALMLARENLKWTLARVIVVLLGWPVSKTEVDLEFLKRYADALINDMSTEQKQITKVFRQRSIVSE